MRAHRKIVRIDAGKCNGCGKCAEACVEGAIEIVDGKARLVSDVYCDGLGACIGECPEDAITIEERMADKFDEEAAGRHAHAAHGGAHEAGHPAAHAHAEGKLPCGCPGTSVREIKRGAASRGSAACCAEDAGVVSQLANWPVQLRLVPPGASFLRGADVLLAADCVPFALADFHGRLLAGRALLVGCPKLDDAEFYVERLADILKEARPRSLTVAHMEVPCCLGLVRIAEEAIERSGVELPMGEVTVGIDGGIVAETVAAGGR